MRRPPTAPELPALACAALARLAVHRPRTAVDHFLRAQVALGLKRDEVALAELAAIPDDHPLGFRVISVASHSIPEARAQDASDG